MLKRLTTFVIGTGIGLGLTGLTISAQEGDIVQRDKAKKEQEMRDRNAQPKTGQASGVDKTGTTDKTGTSSTSGTDKMSSAPTSTKNRKKTSPKTKPDPDPTKP